MRKVDWQRLGVGLVILAVIYQLGFRYDYYRYGGAVQKIDRLMGTSCVLPCISTPVPTIAPTEAPTTEANHEAAAQALRAERVEDAIRIAKSQLDIPQHDVNAYFWKEEVTYANINVNEKFTGDIEHDVDHIFLICLCDKKDIGWDWEVDTTRRTATSVFDNQELKTKYNVK